MSSLEEGSAVVTLMSTWLMPTAPAAAWSWAWNVASAVPDPDGEAWQAPAAELPFPSLAASHGT